MDEKQGYKERSG